MFLSYLEYRKENGKEVKGKAIGYCIDKLESISNSPAEQVAIIKQTIQNGWTDFFPLKGKKEKVIEIDNMQFVNRWNLLAMISQIVCICTGFLFFIEMSTKRCDV